MTHKEKLQAVEKKIREVCTELRKPCRVCGGTGDGADNPMSDHGECYPCGTCNGTGKSINGYYPIHLEHVLRAIGMSADHEVASIKRNWLDIEIKVWGKSQDNFTGYFRYNLTLTLADQSEETIAFLYKVICNY